MRPLVRASSRRPLPRRASLPLLLALLVSAAGVLPAEARRCGDDVDGRGTAIRCACGDVVVSDVRLRADDPVAVGTCATDGLVIDASAPVTVTLDGVVLRGAGRGTGLRVLGGGVVLAGPGGVERFDVGVSAGPGALARAVAVAARDNRRDGFLVRGDDTELIDCVAEDNGRDGVARSGRPPRLEGGRVADNGRDGRRRTRRADREAR
ncbi:MAG: hypothetical protein KIT14_14230 [bacterium]|nr:hypothetical protein [bacterium]